MGPAALEVIGIHTIVCLKKAKKNPQALIFQHHCNLTVGEVGEGEWTSVGC